MCGIFGIITPRPRKLDTGAFCVLGVENDSRGGDSCGIFIDGKYEYGVNDKKLFAKFFPTSKILNSVKTATIALGHCRKASVGAVNEANAQPVIIKKDDKVEFVLMHNGTISNYRELATKYIPDVDVNGMTDSQVMARIFYHKGYDALKEYIGAGAFVMVDYRFEKPRVFMFKGESKPTTYSTTVTVERPLYCTYSGNEFIFSSLITYLQALRPGQEPKTLLTNKLVELCDGKLFVVAEYDRTEMCQQKPTVYTPATNYTPYYGDYYGGGYNGRRFQESLDLEDWGSPYFCETINVDPEGVFLCGTTECHGPRWVSALGDIGTSNERGTQQLWFFKGVLLKNYKCFQFLCKFCKDMGITHEELMYNFVDLVYFFSPYPYVDETNRWVYADTPVTHSVFSGRIKFPFTTEEIRVKKGYTEWTNPGIPYRESFEHALSFKNYEIDMDAITAAFGD